MGHPSDSLRTARQTRHHGLIDLDLMESTALTCFGAGGITPCVIDLASYGIREACLIDEDEVTWNNVATSGFDCEDVGLPKVEAAKRRILRVNPGCCVVTFKCHDNKLTPEQANRAWSPRIIWSMTDSVEAAARINEEALKRDRDLLTGSMHGDNGACDILGTFPAESHHGRGCYACFARERIETNTTVKPQRSFYPSHRASAALLNAKILLITLGILHFRVGSTLPIARIGEAFIEQPALLARIDPALWSAPDDIFGDRLTSGKLFADRQFSRPSQTGWACSACGAAS